MLLVFERFTSFLIVLAHHYDGAIFSAGPLQQVCLFLCVICSVVLGISREGSNLILGLINIILRVAFDGSHGRLHHPEAHPPQIPKDIRTILNKFECLEGKLTTYAVCPNEDCHFTYKPQFHADSNRTSYPHECTHQPTPEDPPCLTPLLKENGQPIKTFVYYDFKDYLAGLLARADLEGAMDDACRVALLKGYTDEFATAFDGLFVHTFKGPQSDKRFIDGGAEGRYLFVINVDWFQKEGVKANGGSDSCSIISMACLNLPLAVRYHPDNMYVAGIIPGPEEPKLNLLNHYLRPLVDDLSIAWHRGVFYKRTALRRNGRVTRAAIAACACDLPAARKTAGLSGTRGKFCGTCNCEVLYGAGRTDFDHTDWAFRDREEMRKHAEKWRNAPTHADRQKIFKTTGVRYSELWRLPYWDPARQVAPDSMHAHLAGNAQNNCRNVLRLEHSLIGKALPDWPAFQWDFKLVTQDDRDSTENPINRNNESDINQIHKGLVQPIQPIESDEHEGSLNRLRKLLTAKTIAALYFVCEDLGVLTDELRPRGARKAPYVQALLDWVSHPSHYLRNLLFTPH